MSEHLTPRDYALALASQSACNLSGIAHGLADVIGRVWEEARAKGEGTDYVNRHSIVRLYAEQIYFLASPREYHDAYAECRRRADETAGVSLAD